VVYNTPEYSSEFITEKLGITEQELSEYEGADLPARHRAMIFASLSEKAALTRENAIEEALWDHLVSRATVKELPKSEVKRAYEETYSWIYLVYANRYSASFESAEHFAAAYYGLSSTAEVPEHVISLAEREVTERLILYSVAEEKSLLPTGDEFTAAYNEAVDERFEAYRETTLKAELDALTGEDFEKRAGELKLEMIDTLGEAYFTELVYYGVVYSALLDYATIR
jgi:FKBP-type peptidyl-prolyl cis-trans isomerase (trigger factor)